jgi:hypothetical protein
MLAVLRIKREETGNSIRNACLMTVFTIDLQEAQEKLAPYLIETLKNLN